MFFDHLHHSGSSKRLHHTLPMTMSATPSKPPVERRRRPKAAIDRLFPQILAELKETADRLIQRRPAGGQLTATALVHEAYLKLVAQSPIAWSDRAHFRALCACVMRQILVDRFRRQRSGKHGGACDAVPLQEEVVSVETPQPAGLVLAQALDHLSDVDPRKAKVVRFRFCGRMSDRAIAEVLEMSPRTVRRDWRTAKAWLARWLGSAPSGAST